MIRFLMAAILLALAAPAAAQLYKWVDKDGKTHYSDTPPPNLDSKQITPASGGAAAAPAPAKGAVARDKDLEKGRKDSRDAAKKGDEEAKLAAARDEQCTRARSNYQMFVDGGRVHKYDAKGERVFLGDDEMEAEKAKARAQMDEACKKS